MPIIEFLDADRGIYSWGLDAAACLRDPALLPYPSAYDPDDSAVAAALCECDPVARAERDAFAAALLDGVHRRIPATEVTLFATRFEPGLTLEMAVDGRALTWSVDGLMDRAEGDAERAADAVVRDRAMPFGR